MSRRRWPCLLPWVTAVAQLSSTCHGCHGDAMANPRLQTYLAMPPSPALQIMGRSENDELSASQVFYPCMQAADIFFLKVR